MAIGVFILTLTLIIWFSEITVGVDKSDLDPIIGCIPIYSDPDHVTLTRFIEAQLGTNVNIN